MITTNNSFDSILSKLMDEHDLTKEQLIQLALENLINEPIVVQKIMVKDYVKRHQNENSSMSLVL